MMIIRNARQTEAGYVVVTVAAMLIILVGFTALAIDTGILFANRTQAQRAADAAALAGAYTFVEYSLTGAPAQAVAEDHARATAYKNTVMGIPIAPAEVQVTFPAARQVKVTITRQEPSFFAKILGAVGMNVTSRVEARAEAADAPTSAMCLKPFFIPNTLKCDTALNGAGAPCEDLASSTDSPCTNCNTPKLLIGADLQPTAYAQSMVGKSFILKPQDPKAALAPSQFFILDLDGGKSQLASNIGTCLTKASACRNIYTILPGNTVGLKKGVDDLIGTPPRDSYVQNPATNCPNGLPCYLYPNGTKHDTSRALALAPIWNPCVPQDDGSAYCPFPSGAGTDIKIIGFALVFIDKYQDTGPQEQRGIHAHLIKVLRGCDPDSTWDFDGPTAFSLPLRLVRPQ